MKRFFAWTLVLAVCFGLLGTAAAAQMPFADVKEGTYYEDAVLWAVENGIAAGMTPTRFDPERSCTRAQVVTFLWRACGSPEPEGAESGFQDVSKTAYYYKAVLWAVENGITAGMTETQFAPDRSCTRGQVVSFLHRACGKPVATITKHSFTDVSTTGYYYRPMLWALQTGVTAGMSATEFAPDRTCTRAQVVTFLYRADDMLEKELYVAKHPENAICGVGDAVEFVAQAAGGEAPYTYRWQVGGAEFADISEEALWAEGEDTPVLSLRATPEDFELPYYYRCVITDAQGDEVVTAPARCVKVKAPLAVEQHPQDMTCAPGDAVELTAKAAGGAQPYTYRWQYTLDGVGWRNLYTGGSFDVETPGVLKILVDEQILSDCKGIRCAITDADGTTVYSDPAQLLPQG